MNIHTSFVKSIGVIAIVITLFAGTFLPAKKAHAFLGFGDLVTDFGNIFQSTTTAINSVLDPLKEYGLDGVVTNITQRLLNKLVDNTLVWANGGFDGKPGYIHNWDDFLVGASVDVLNYGIGQATSFANVKMDERREDSKVELLRQCENDAEASLPENPSQEQIDAAYNDCRAYWSQERIKQEYDRCIDKAEESLGSDPTDAEISAARANCNKPVSTSTSTAQENWLTYNSGDLNSSRSNVGVITKIGARAINGGTDQKLDALLRGDGETMTTILGSQGAVDAFENGKMTNWAAYAAFGDPHNNKPGRNALVTNAILKKMQERRAEKTREVDTSNTFLDKTECEEYKIDAEGNETKECEREVIKTSGNQVAAKVDFAINKEERQAENAKELTDVMAQALGRLGRGLMTAGIAHLGNKKKEQGASQAAKEDPRFKDVYQNDYDVLGIGSGNTGRDDETEATAPRPNEASPLSSRFSLNSTSLSRDSSIPPIEDLERIVNIHTDLNRGFNNTREQILTKGLTIGTLKAAHADVRDLDRCIPGPDYNWQERFQGLIDTTGSGYGGKFEDASQDDDEDEGVVEKIEKKEGQVREKLDQIDLLKFEVDRLQAEIDQLIEIIGDSVSLAEVPLVLQKEAKIKDRNFKNNKIGNLQSDVDKLHGEIEELRKNIVKPDNYTSPGVNAQANKLAFNNIQAMVNDSNLNIPGAIEMRNLINSYVKSGNLKIARGQESIDTLKDTASSLKKLYDVILPEFETYRAALANEREEGLVVFLKIPLIGNVWDELTEAEKIGIINLKAENVTLPPEPTDLFAATGNGGGFIGNNALTQGGGLSTNTQIQGGIPGYLQATFQVSQPPIESQILANQDRALPTYLFEVEGADGSAMILNEANGLTPTEFLKNNPEKTEELVLGYAWKILKDGLLASPADPSREILDGEERYANILRYFFIMKNSIPTDKDLITAELELNNAKESNERLANYKSDCQTLRKFVTGHISYPMRTSEATIGGGDVLELTYSSGEHEYYEKKNGQAFMLHVNTLTDEFKYNFIFEPGSSKTTSPSRTEIDKFLTAEAAKQKAGQPSVFKTDVITSRGNREASILNFTASDMRIYYRNNYGEKPNRSLENNPIPLGNLVAYDIQKLYERDYVKSSFTSNNRKVFGQTGLLFCWSQGDYSLNKKGKVKDQDKVISECLKPWYYAKDIDYKILFSGII